MKIDKKPTILLLVDKPNWAFDFIAKSIVKWLKDEYNFIIEYVAEKPELGNIDFDLIYIFWWGETYHHLFNIDSKKVIKEVASHRWENEEKFGKLNVEQFIEKYLHDIQIVTTVSHKLFNLIMPFKTTMLSPRGFDPDIFYNMHNRNGRLKIGWAGNIKDKCKGVKEILRPALFPLKQLHVAKGDLSISEMKVFYNSIDIICVASTAEGEPITLTEAMACGCFPVVVDVGIVPELIQDRQNGLIVARNPSAFRKAFKWCSNNLDEIRAIGDKNAKMMLKTRTWDNVINNWRLIFTEGLRLNGWEIAESKII